MSIVKQVIVMRTDLRNKDGNKVRTGKLISQGAHAAIAFLLHTVSIDPIKVTSRIKHPQCFRTWLSQGQTKITVGVNSESELIELYEKAEAANIQVEMIVDAGHTEFDGVATRTCIAIGPFWSKEIDRITGHLKLF